MDTTAFNEGLEKTSLFGLGGSGKPSMDPMVPNTESFFKRKAKETLGYGIKTVTDNPSIRRFIGNNVSPETKAQLANDEIGKSGYGNYGSVEVVDGKLQPKINYSGSIGEIWDKITGAIKAHPVLAGLGVGAGGLGLMSLLGGGGNSGGGTVNNYYSSAAPAGQTIKPNLQANIQSGDGFSAAGYHQV